MTDEKPPPESNPAMFVLMAAFSVWLVEQVHTSVQTNGAGFLLATAGPATTAEAPTDVTNADVAGYSGCIFAVVQSFESVGSTP